MLAAVVFAVGMVGFNLSDGTITLIDDVPLATMESGMFSGHLEIIHTDKDGNILSYQQTDNAIVNQGRNCAANMLFGPLANTACDAISPGVYNVIGISNVTFAGNNQSEDLTSEIESGDGLTRADGALTGESQLEAATGVTGDVSKTLITAEFTYTGTQTGNPVQAAGLFNSTTVANDSVFALKNFPSVVNMNNGDKLTVNWEISISGTDSTS